MKTKIVLFVLILTMLMGLTSCSKDKNENTQNDSRSPDMVLTDFVAAINSCDFVLAGSMTTAPDSISKDIDSLYTAIQEKIGGAEISADFSKTVMEPTFQKVKIVNIDSVKINGKYATVQATLSAADLKNILADVGEKYKNISEEQLLEILKDVENWADQDAVAAAMFNDVILEIEKAFAAPECKMTQGTVEVQFLLRDGSWLIDAENYGDLFKLMTGMV